MLTSLTVRNIVLIDALDLDFREGLTVLTGETGAGKSILLDAMGLVLGARANGTLIRPGADAGDVTATFATEALSAALRAALDDADLTPDTGEPLILRRTLRADGGTKAFVNGRAVPAAMLRDLGGLLVEIHGQHDERGLLAPAGHRALLDAYGRCDTGPTAAAHAAWVAALAKRDAARDAIENAERDREWLTHAVAELTRFAAQPGEEAELADARATMQKGERLADDLSTIRAAFDGSDSAAAQLRTAARRLDRIAPDHAALAAALAAIDRALVELDDAEQQLDAAAAALAFDPDRLDAMETRLFDLRAMARKHQVEPDALHTLADTLAERLAAVDAGADHLAALDAAVDAAEADYRKAAAALTKARNAAAKRLDAAVAAELRPLKLEHARFATAFDALSDQRAGPDGADRVEFLIATNNNADLAPMMKIASGGELSRFLLALKVALAETGGAATIVFDEIDRGVGGAVADAIGERLARLSDTGRQVLVVTHSPQVAARGAHHWQIAKTAAGKSAGARTDVSTLDPAARVEEIARMLSGSAVTAEARAQAERLLHR